MSDIKIKDFKNGDDPDWIEEHPGRQTGSITKAIELPVSYLIKLPALRDEHKQLHMDMEKIKGMSKSCVLEKSWRAKNPMTLNVLHNDRVLVEDGSHRIRAAKLAKLKTYPCVVKFYGGSEDNFDKIMAKFASENFWRQEIKSLVALARKIIQNGGDLTIVTNTLNKIAEQEIGGNADNFGGTGDQEYDNMREIGEDPAGENSPDKGQQRRTGPREDDPDYDQSLDKLMVQEAGFGNSQEKAKARKIKMRELGRVNVTSPQVPRCDDADCGLCTKEFSTKDPQNKEANFEDRLFRIKQIAEHYLEPFDIEHVNSGGTKPLSAAPPSIKIKEDIDDETGKEMPPEFQYSRTLNPEAPTHQQVRKFEFNTPEKPENNFEFTENRVVPDEFGHGTHLYNQHAPEFNKTLLNNVENKDCMNKEASSNKPCAKCGAPTDVCVCIDMKQPTMGKNPSKTTIKVDPRMKAPDVSKQTQAMVDLTNAIIAHGKMSRVASHIEEIEIPFGDLKLETGINYRMSGRLQEVNMLIQRYLKLNVYHPPVHFTIANIDEEKNKFFVKCLVFDHGIENEAASVTNTEVLHKLSNVTPKKLEKTAWKKRLTEVIGSNDETGLVKCPLEGNFLTRSCGACPLAENPTSYIQDGFVICHYDDLSSWLDNGKQVREHKKEMPSM